ncbi:MAG: hypothetical protein NC299_07505 [Lachnospiraceae bacterium]|nr:hypothetical protein [Ruminococcus sp.]MCM1275201.1 hypothetical protein [Lachnospiraceae bacterium]
MKRNIIKLVLTAALVVCIIPLCSCGSAEESRAPEPRPSESAFPDKPAAAPTAVLPTKRRAESPKHADENKLSFTAENVFSEGEYYNVIIEGERLSGTLFGNFRLVLEKDGERLDSLSVEVADGDKFLIMESVLKNLTYGCTVISNKREFSTDAYPDIIQLDFYNESDPEIPQYGRYFAVFGGRLSELAVYENGAETAPRGTYLKLRGEGRMVQRLCVYTPSGKSLMVEEFEYIFDAENKRLNKRETVFLGWNVNN